MSSQKSIKSPTYLDVLSQIRNEQPHFSTAMRLVADYVLKHFHKIPFLSISALSENIGVSPNTVIKFCNHLGFERFAEFKKVFSEHARTTLAAPSISSSDGLSIGSDLFAQRQEEEFSVISETLNNPANHENLPEAISMVTNAKRVYVCGGSRSYPLASIFTFGLQSMCVPSQDLHYEVSTFWINIRTAKPEELVIFIMMPPYSDVAVDIMQKLQKKKVPILLLTDTGLSPALPHADLTLYCAYRDNHYLYSNIGVHAMLNVLSQGVNYELDARKYRRNQQRK